VKAQLAHVLVERLQKRMDRMAWIELGLGHDLGQGPAELIASPGGLGHQLLQFTLSFRYLLRLATLPSFHIRHDIPPSGVVGIFLY
jgi:hypothetical protein